MEEFALDRTQREVGALLKSSPKRATLILDDGIEKETAVAELRVAKRCAYGRAKRSPLMAACLQGKSASDESSLTGEAHARRESEWETQVFSGTLNLWGSIDFEVMRVAAESTLQKIIRLIQTAQKTEGPERTVHG